MEAKAANITPTSLASSSSSNSDKMNYALQVALQTMKERCIQLQRRVSNMEEENQRLRENTATGTGTRTVSATGTGSTNGDIISLRSRVDELQRQKEQLEDQNNMVANENRRLWARLSKISKDQPLLTRDDDAANTSYIRSAGITSIGANQNLIRSKTFTQHSPNPQLRQKLITEMSLEEVALDEFETKLGYPYGLNVDDVSTVSGELDANADAKHCMDGLQDLRREAMKQQQQLNSALTQLETRLALHPCPECAKKAANKPEMADKSLETEDNSEHPSHYTFNGHVTTMTTPLPPTPTPRFNIIQEKINADSIDKTCPMCGKLYSCQVSFKAFQEHVEMHFIDDALDVDASVERQFEFISHAVGDF
ncbi:protein spindle-F [Drosophila grimshawi]|uniref:GH18010 n=1 Tax=Drosophila grimshawi TaxID=7222 RepID=B4JI20_DROGR|nr:protein spindle-F [Drosophila grimshawi]EDV93940.1 GH18010 [Drosophila grimshawi]